MSRRKIKKGAHKKKLRGNYRQRTANPLEVVKHQRKQRKKLAQKDEERMRRLGTESITVEQKTDFSLDIPDDAVNERDVFNPMNNVGVE